MIARMPVVSFCIRLRKQANCTKSDGESDFNTKFSYKSIPNALLYMLEF